MSKHTFTLRPSVTVDLEHFLPAEFRHWWPWMAETQVLSLDRFRHRLADVVGQANAAVLISPNEDALGRHGGALGRSRHNVDAYGLVYATDVLLPHVDLTDEPLARRVIDLACEVFGGVGLYLEWQPHNGLHLDSRPHKRDGSSATWCRADGEYLALDEAWPRWRAKQEREATT